MTSPWIPRRLGMPLFRDSRRRAAAVSNYRAQIIDRCPMNRPCLIPIVLLLVIPALCLGPWAGVAQAAPVHNTFNDVWTDEVTQHWYDNLTEAGANERRLA